MISLVTITHPIDPGAEVPFIGGRTPCIRIKVETYIAETLQKMGFVVEFHEKNYDPVAVQAEKAAKLAAALASQKPAKIEAPKVEEIKIESVEAVEAPKAEETKVEPAEAPKVEVEPAEAPKVEVESVEAPKVEETEAASAEEAAALRARISALDTLEKAKAFVAEFSIELDPSLKKLKDIRSALLEMVDAK